MIGNIEGGTMNRHIVYVSNNTFGTMSCPSMFKVSSDGRYSRKALKIPFLHVTEQRIFL